MNTLIKYADLSDKGRWDANCYDFDVNPTESDKKLLSLLSVIGEGEFTGISSGLLLPKMIMDEVPKKHQKDFAEILVYMNIIIYEEFRHGMAISTLLNIEPDLSDVFNIDTKHYWGAYGLLLSHCLSEATNAILYNSLIKQIEDPGLIKIFTNIQKDEARHLSAWKHMIKDIINKDPYHKKMALAALDDGINKHNAMIGDNYFQGVKDTIKIFKPSALNDLVLTKHKILMYWFGDDNPYSITDLKISHLNFLRDHIHKS
jgi:rubrerythrin